IRNFAFIDGRTKTTFFSDKKVLAKKDAKWIYLDEELNELLSFGIFDEAEPFTENGFAIVMKDSVYGIINNKGKYVYNLEYNSVHHPEKYSDRIEMFVLEKDGVYQMLDKNAKPITDFNIEDYDIDNNDKYDVLLIYKTI